MRIKFTHKCPKWRTCVSTKRSQHGRKLPDAHFVKMTTFSPLYANWPEIRYTNGLKMVTYFPLYAECGRKRDKNCPKWSRWLCVKMTHTFPLICVLAWNSWPESMKNDAYFSPYMRFGLKFLTRIDENWHPKNVHDFPLICKSGRKTWPKSTKSCPYFSPYMQIGSENVTKIVENDDPVLTPMFSLICVLTGKRWPKSR